MLRGESLRIVDQIWPCWKYQDSGTMTDDALPISPVKVGEMATSHGDIAPMYLVGYFGGKPVYRTTSYCAQGKKILYFIFF